MVRARQVTDNLRQVTVRVTRVTVRRLQVVGRPRRATVKRQQVAALTRQRTVKLPPIIDRQRPAQVRHRPATVSRLRRPVMAQVPLRHRVARLRHQATVQVPRTVERPTVSPPATGHRPDMPTAVRRTATVRELTVRLLQQQRLLRADMERKVLRVQRAPPRQLRAPAPRGAIDLVASQVRTPVP